MKKNIYNSPDIRLFECNTTYMLCASDPGLSNSIETFKEESSYSGAINWY